jgi:predicted Zn-dependent protease
MAGWYQATARAPKRFVASLLITASVLPGCAHRAVPPIGVAGTPFTPDADERRLWAEAEREEEKFQQAGGLYGDPLLEAYLARIGERLTPGEVRRAGGPSFEFHVVRDPTLSAFAMPNGKVYVHTGLLARVEDEAQLAMILAHEITHVTNRHSLQFRRDARGRVVPLSVRAIAESIGAAATAPWAEHGDRVGTAGLSPTAQVVLGLGLKLAALAAIQGYGRDLEREADTGGLQQLVAAGYDPHEAPKVFALLGREARERGAPETFLFGNPRRLDEGLKDTEDQVQTRYAGVRGEVNTEEFALRTRTVVRDNALLDIHAGRFTLAQAQLDRVLALAPKDPAAHLYYGDLYRLRAQRAHAPGVKESLAQQALGHYLRAADLDPAFPDPFRELGFLYYQQKETARAKEAFQKYLALKPDAPDAGRIREYLIELDR